MLNATIVASSIAIASQDLAMLTITIFEYHGISNTVKAFKLVFVKAKCEIIAYFIPFCIDLLFYPLQRAEMNVWTVLNCKQKLFSPPPFLNPAYPDYLPSFHFNASSLTMKSSFILKAV